MLEKFKNIVNITRPRINNNLTEYEEICKILDINISNGYSESKVKKNYILTFENF